MPKYSRQGMSQQQKKFCDYWIKTGNATQSAIDAGYSQKTARQQASDILARPYIQEYIQKRIKKAENERTASAEEVLDYLTRVMRGEEIERKTKVIDGDSVEVETPPTIYERTRAAELLGKRHMLFTDRRVTDMRVGELTPEDRELLERVAQRVDD